MTSPATAARDYASLGNNNPVFSKLSTGLQQQQPDFPQQKNLSHVPCKFFRQGQCQAGNTCPFSHSYDAVGQSPCKYFQKGNCKFGAKCALAHILPDGRRVNQRQQQFQQQQSQQPLQQSQQSQQHPPQQQQPPVQQQGQFLSSTQQLQLQLQQQQQQQQSILQVSSIKFNEPYSLSNNSPVGSVKKSDDIHRSLSNQSIWNTPTGTSASRKSSVLQRPPMGLLATSFSSVTVDECAIDDEDDGLAYQEDFVPSSLTDLLTPQERERRGSRPSSATTPVSFATTLIPTQQTSSVVVGNSEIWSSSPRLATRKTRDNSFSELAGSPLRHTYPAPIGTPERSSSLLKQFSAIGTPLGTSPSINQVLVTKSNMINSSISGAGTNATSSKHNTESLFDDINPMDFDETQFHMDDEEGELDHSKDKSENKNLHLVADEVIGNGRELYQNMESLVR